MSTSRQRLVGEICGLGTEIGTRLVIGRWTSTPYGPFADVMVELAGGRRLLLAPNAEIAELITALYEFDEVIVEPVVAERASDRLRIAAGPLLAEVTIGARDALGWCLRATPRRIATSTAFAAAVDPIARIVLRGVRTRGRTSGGQEFYGATDRHRVTAVRATWDGNDLGELRPVDPPVRFGFSSTPKRPSIVEVTTTVITN
ncbi:MAG: hypothetical protein ABIR68_16400 [Ilumatobacteraceae bacterium]